MRSIDVDALKEEILKKQFTVTFCLEHGIERSISLEMLWIVLDNAPTVEMPKAIGTVDKNGNIKLELLRMQGEWITKGYEPFGKCNICGSICEINNFCGHCGVKMKYNTEK